MSCALDRLVILQMTEFYKAGVPDCDAFYLRPLGKFNASDPERTWFYARDKGHNFLKGMLKTMCWEGGVPCADRSNHILRATGATGMLDAGAQRKSLWTGQGIIRQTNWSHTLKGQTLQQQQVSAAMTRSEVKESLVLHEVQNVPSTQNVSVKVEIIKGIVSNTVQPRLS